MTPDWDAIAEPRLVGFSRWELLGRGGFGSVYGAVREADGREVAIKIAATRNDRRFAREARVLARVGPPTVPELFGEGETPDGAPYLVMERLRGRTLAEMLTPGRPRDDAVALFSRVVAAVARLHDAGVVHRDLKPANLFFRADGGVSILDFGLSLFIGETANDPTTEPSRVTASGERIGTCAYMAPEQCRAEPTADVRTDVYALGIILFELLTGAPPFGGDPSVVQAAHIARRPPRPSRVAKISPVFDELVLRCLAKRPEDRFASARTLLESLPTADAATASCETVTSGEAGPLAPVRARRPVALLAIATGTSQRRVAEAIAAERGQLVRVQAGRYLAAFADAPSAAAGIEAARRVAGRLADVATDCVIHVAELVVRTVGPRTLLVGSALEAPEAWVEGAGVDTALGMPGVRLTAAARASAEGTGRCRRQRR